MHVLSHKVKKWKQKYPNIDAMMIDDSTNVISSFQVCHLWPTVPDIKRKKSWDCYFFLCTLRTRDLPQ